MVRLIEARRRKAVFLQEASRGLANVRVLAERAEAVEETFDWVVSRAVKWEDLRQTAMRLAPAAAFLTAEGGIPCPWGARRFVRIVSRGT